MSDPFVALLIAFSAFRCLPGFPLCLGNPPRKTALDLQYAVFTGPNETKCSATKIGAQQHFVVMRKKNT